MSSPTPPDIPQPPTQAAYNQPLNPISQTPVEQQHTSTTTRRYGDPPPAIRRTPDSRPSSDIQLLRLEKERRQQRDEEARRAGDIDTEYGVEQQPAEGYIAAAVEGKNQYNRLQAGAHAGPVGSAQGPGFMGEQEDTAAEMDRKREEHDHILGQRAGKSPAFSGDSESEGDGGDGTDVERQQLRERKRKEKEELDVKGSVSRGSGNVVV
ncbi:hypothetical protein VTN77DRAFT_6316 [Rasamsonia byssochlamydoides]|uniref:uncharacterized protein n=1 Tax=Rasamsonia byssochlamydoides TaxID=89139 RepID=UPI003742CB8D